MIDTTITIGGIAIHEPVTAFTDYIITSLCFIYMYKLKSSKKSPSVKFWKLFFLLFGCSTLVGGCSHAFFAIHEGLGYKSFWLAMQVLNGFAVFFAQQATLNSVLADSPKRNLWKQAYIIQLVVFLIAVILFQNFLVVVLDNALGLIPVMIIHFMDRKNPAASKMIANGVLISFLTAFVHGAKLSVCAYFNFNDISHVLIMCSLSVVFIGARKLSKTVTP